ncbi:MAG: hypothetical protein MJE77_10990 [Proteobacteria bacterium]|nr:hypothetical protein [Pseudomonadota bacterium]
MVSGVQNHDPRRHGRVVAVRRNKNAPRHIPVLPTVADALREHRQRLRDTGVNVAEGWMFPTRVGTLRAVSSLAKAFKLCNRRAGITGRFSVHGLRYTFTDNLRFARVDPVVRRELTGHATARMQAN